MTAGDTRLKRFLVLQSFAPLFVLVLIKYGVELRLVWRFCEELIKNPIEALDLTVHHKEILNVVIGLLSCIWLIVTVIVARGFKDLQNYGFQHHGESILLGEQKNDTSVTFLVTFILPLLVDNVETSRGFAFFVVLLLMIIALLMKTNLYYQNPVLLIMGYRVYEFKFLDPAQDVEEDKIYIGITKGLPLTGNASIRRKLIADNVFLVYND